MLNNEESVYELYEIFLDECELQGINPDMPTLYQGSKEQLLSVDVSDKSYSTIQMHEKSPIELINEFSQNIDKNFSVEQQVDVLKMIYDTRKGELTNADNNDFNHSVQSKESIEECIVSLHKILEHYRHLNYEFFSYDAEKRFTDKISFFEAQIQNYDKIKTDKSNIKFSARDIGEASYDADTSLCQKCERVTQDIQRSSEKDEPNQ